MNDKQFLLFMGFVGIVIGLVSMSHSNVFGTVIGASILVVADIGLALRS